ncbi:MAG: hypothetical protein RL607_205 [Bacteroidota bacterium]|jgi:hypothetical protein
MRTLFLLFAIVIGSWAKAQKGPIIQIATQDTAITAFSGRGLVSPRYIIQPDRVVYQKDAATSLVLTAHPKTFRISTKDFTRRFGLDDQGVYVDGQFVPVDTTGFKVIGELRDPEYKLPTKFYWKTKSQLFLDTQEITGVDVPTFGMLYSSADRYTKDKYRVYYYGKPIPNINPEAVIYLNEARITDEKIIYEMGEPLRYKGEIVQYVNHFLGKTKTTVINLQSFQPIPSIQAATLEPLSKSYAFDHKGVYYGFTKTNIPLNARKSYKVWETGNYHWIKVGSKLYLGGLLCEFSLDAASFGTLPHSDYYYDKKGIYYRKWDEKLQKIIQCKIPFHYSISVNDKTVALAYASRFMAYSNQIYDIVENKVYTNVGSEQLALVKNGTQQLAPIQGKLYPCTIYDYKLVAAKGVIYWGDQVTEADAATFQMGYPYCSDKTHTYVYDRNRGLQVVDGLPKLVYEKYQPFATDETYVYINNYRTIKKGGVRLLAIYEGYRPGCGLDKHPSSDFYLFENEEGFWCIQASTIVTFNFLGKTLPVRPSGKG